MSFSAEIKEELSKINNLANKECIRAEFIGYLLSSNIEVTNTKIKYATENEYNINRFNKLLTNLGIDYNILFQGKVYIITFSKKSITLSNGDSEATTNKLTVVNELEYVQNKIQINAKYCIEENEQFLKSIVRGAFLGGGSLNNPNNKYHLEILFSTVQNANYILELLKQFNIQSKILKRKSSCSIYIKEAEEISKFLALVGANKAVLNFEEIRVVRDTRNNINRLVNCETANLNKTINAAVNQINAIKILKENKRFDELPDNLKEIAKLRIKNPDASLVELGQMLSNPIGKSGVNHRLKKICEIAEDIK